MAPLRRQRQEGICEFKTRSLVYMINSRTEPHTETVPPKKKTWKNKKKQVSKNKKETL